MKTRLARGLDAEELRWMQAITTDTFSEWCEKAPWVYDDIGCVCDGTGKHLHCPHHWWQHVNEPKPQRRCDTCSSPDAVLYYFDDTHEGRCKRCMGAFLTPAVLAQTHKVIAKITARSSRHQTVYILQSLVRA